MKHLPLLLVILAGVWLGYVGLRAHSPAYEAPELGVPTRLSGEVPAGYLVRSFAVEGMCCESCTGKLHGALAALEGVEEAAVDFDAGMASAVVAASVPLERVLAALNVEKYRARPLP